MARLSHPFQYACVHQSYGCAALHAHAQRSMADPHAHSPTALMHNFAASHQPSCCAVCRLQQKQLPGALLPGQTPRHLHHQHSPITDTRKASSSSPQLPVVPKLLLSGPAQLIGLL